MDTRIWVVPTNDLEGLEIVYLVRTKSERYVTTGQPWGATWQGLEPAVERTLREFRSEWSGATIYGIELRGKNDFRAVNIDHHQYPEEDRSHRLSSLEQVAEILGEPLSRWQKLVALNDRGYIPAMEDFDASPAEIEDVRHRDRKAQGITDEEERIAQEDIRARQTFGSLAVVQCRHSRTAAYWDRLYGRADESLLISPTEWNYQGPRSRDLAALRLCEDHWSGGAEGRGYFGIVKPGEPSRQQIARVLGLNTGSVA